LPTLDFTVRGMTCGSCANRVQRTLGKQPGVAVAEVNFATATARVCGRAGRGRRGGRRGAEGGGGQGRLRVGAARRAGRGRPGRGGGQQDEEAAAQRSWLWRLNPGLAARAGHHDDCVLAARHGPRVGALA